MGTPNTKNGQVDLSAVEETIDGISKMSKVTKTVIIKSTVPPNTNNELSKKYANLNFISSPEFLREGSAIADCFSPDRVIVGSRNSDDLALITKIYAQFNISTEKFLHMDSATAEITKYASNIFLATRISLINELSRVCEKSGADIEVLKIGLGLDPRIGNKYLNPGIGYGGSCFPKDTEAFLNYATTLGENLKITKAVKETNEYQIKHFAEKIIGYFRTMKYEKTICIWGVSFKPDTDDVREAPALKLIDYLLADNLKLHIFDPKSSDNLTYLFMDNPQVKVFKNAFEAIKNTDALVIATEWKEFAAADLNEVKAFLKFPVVFDGRNIFDPVEMKNLGFEYYSVGRA